MTGRRLAIALVATGVVMTLVAGWFVLGGGYRIKVVMPSAGRLIEGSVVKVEGSKVGEVSALETRSGKAVATIELRGGTEMVPLHTGTTARTVWKSVIGARYVELRPGPESNPTLPEGSLVEASEARVQVEDLLAMLDERTRKRVRNVVHRLEATMKGDERNINETLQTAGAAVEALGQVMRGVAGDGQAIKTLVVQLQNMIAPLAERQATLRRTVNDLVTFTRSVVDRDRQLRSTLREFPELLETADKTFAKLSDATEPTVELLRELQPATAKLPSVANDLAPLLTVLRPTVADLRPAVDSTRLLLKHTPDLLDMTHATVPNLTTTIKELVPVLDFLRPYTPELTGFMANWSGAFQSYDSMGHYGRGLVTVSASGANEIPTGSPPPGINKSISPAPGSPVGQPWVDANGDKIR